MRSIAATMATCVGTAVLFVSALVVAGPDDDVAARVRTALAASGLPDAANIVVATFNGEAELSGTVRSDHARAEAARVVAGVPGVTAVRNDLAVRGPRDGQDADDVIADRVRAALAAGIPGGRDTTVAVFNGTVALSGVVSAVEIRAAAARVAGEVRGVTAVRNDLVVREP